MSAWQPPPETHPMNGAHPGPDHLIWASKGFPCSVPHFLSHKVLKEEYREKHLHTEELPLFSFHFFLYVLLSELALQLLHDL